MKFCKKLSLYILILLVSTSLSGCAMKMKKIIFHRDSAYDSFVNKTDDNSKPHRVGNVVYMGTDTSGKESNGGSMGPSFDFDKLKRN